MTDSPYEYRPEPPELPTRRSLRAAERAREQEAAVREEAARQAFIAEYEEERRRTHEPDQYDDSDPFGFAPDSDAFAHPADDTSSAFYTAGAPDDVFKDLPAPEPIALPEPPAPVEQTKVNYFALGALAIAVIAAGLTLVPAAEVVTVPLSVMALVVAVIGIARRKGGILLPAIALVVALAAAGWSGYHTFAPQTPAAVVTPTTISVTTTGKTIYVTDGQIGATPLPASSTTAVAAPYSTSGTGIAHITAAPVHATDTVTCTITTTGNTVAHQVGKPGQPVTCASGASTQPTPVAIPTTKEHR